MNIVCPFHVFTAGIEDVTALDYMPVLYNFYDVLAEAGCMGWVKDNQAVGVWAMRRSCNGVKTCNEVCNYNRQVCVFIELGFGHEGSRAQTSHSACHQVVLLGSVFTFYGKLMDCGFDFLG